MRTRWESPPCSRPSSPFNQQSWDRFASIAKLSPTGRTVDLGRFGNVLHRIGVHSVDRVRFTFEERLRGGWGGHEWTEGASRRVDLEWHDRLGLPADGTGVAPSVRLWGWPERWQQVGTAEWGELDRITIQRSDDAQPFQFLARWDDEPGRRVGWS